MMVALFLIKNYDDEFIALCQSYELAKELCDSFVGDSIIKIKFNGDSNE